MKLPNPVGEHTLYTYIYVSARIQHATTYLLDGMEGADGFFAEHILGNFRFGPGADLQSHHRAYFFGRTRTEFEQVLGGHLFQTR